MFTSEGYHKHNKIVQLNISTKEATHSSAKFLHYPISNEEILLIVSKCLNIKRKELQLLKEL
ncbi:MAG: hypothetical protein Q8930_03610 [Bacillota bacterium]|nr:hypothetical protein [Bacillota bacterium]